VIELKGLPEHGVTPPALVNFFKTYGWELPAEPRVERKGYKTSDRCTVRACLCPMMSEVVIQAVVVCRLAFGG
jgi:hypothetical protein